MSFSDIKQVYANIVSQSNNPSESIDYVNALIIVNNDVVNYNNSGSPIENSLQEIERHFNLLNLVVEKRSLLISCSNVKYSFESEEMYQAERNLILQLNKEITLLKDRINIMINILTMNNPELEINRLSEYKDELLKELPKSSRPSIRRSSSRSSIDRSSSRDSVNSFRNNESYKQHFLQFSKLSYDNFNNIPFNPMNIIKSDWK